MLVLRRNRKEKDLLNLFFFEELSKFKVVCEHVIFGNILFSFRSVFAQI